MMMTWLQGGNCAQNRIGIADLPEGVDPFQSGPGNGQGDGRRPGGDEKPIIGNLFPFVQDQLLRGGFKGNGFPAELQIDPVHFRPGGVPESNSLSGGLSPDPIGEHHRRTGDFPLIRNDNDQEMQRSLRRIASAAKIPAGPPPMMYYVFSLRTKGFPDSPDPAKDRLNSNAQEGKPAQPESTVSSVTGR